MRADSRTDSKDLRSVAKEVRHAAATCRKQGRDPTPQLERIQAEVDKLRSR